MPGRWKTFQSCEDGAVTVDFVVLTAGVIGLAMLFILPVLAEAVNWGEAIATLASDRPGG
jgi:hypothetical protein